ncbi:MAG TPA: hypothetical protein VGQ96_00640, partial [Candidatus Eremiobacteraceae bacterium]|nr:hypothetical protein [Candidatus Eremiobacteraceae bacterium]
PAILPPLSRLSVAAYFTMLGIGYLLIEIAVLQRVILFTGQPVLAASIVFAIFLIGSGVGSAMAPEARTRRAALLMFAAIGIGFAIAATALWLATDVLLEPPMTPRLTLVIMLTLPLAWAMGRPFPWALRQLADQPRWVPWAWAINGFASVAAASLAPLISVHHGQPATLAGGLLCYVVAMTVALRWTTAGTLFTGQQNRRGYFG